LRTFLGESTNRGGNTVSHTLTGDAQNILRRDTEHDAAAIHENDPLALRLVVGGLDDLRRAVPVSDS
jgi:hypothetical protein